MQVTADLQGRCQSGVSKDRDLDAQETEEDEEFGDPSPIPTLHARHQSSDQLCDEVRDSELLTNKHHKGVSST
jgi:hypothetical protein